MALIYQCDRCERNFKVLGDLIRVEFGANEDMYEDRWLNRSDIKLPYKKDLCRECVKIGLLALLPETKTK